MTGTTSLIPEQRRQRILRLLRKEQVLSYRQITEHLGVSQMTARRDVSALAEQGRLLATQGGAAAITKMVSEPRRADKAAVNRLQKSAIAELAASFVTDAMTIYLDAGTTVQAMRPHLESRRDLTIVSNDLGTIQAFLDHPSAELICVGGRVDRDNESMVGRLAALTLAELSLDLAILSTSSWDAHHGATTPMDAKVEAKRAAHASATSSILLADSAKFGTYAKYRVLGLDDFVAVITDDGLSDTDSAELGSIDGANVQIAVVDAMS
ncbi:DeoR/GlpR family DNA-binding transcription regulator [Microbacterium murale]|uniref:DeoR/GlpR family transcriptional regulator of sugar metabolism n=1 Tax=Microbacterium murale TaxID=1081040 RepID=A0ABU0P8X2_9MICO|nr:DeoR/GlpR family DNA-binding transcription regulator [Microbacterium murale]MDQ0643780.1 DeoR/GlpR family transcriptional regulator of sugar metabolism [Microbacterium murale]